MSDDNLDKEILYSVNRWLGNLSETNATVCQRESLLATQDNISKSFKIDVRSVDDFLKMDYGPELNNIVDAGVNKLGAVLWEEDIR